MKKTDGIPSNCTFCGLCCTLTVRLSNEDIKRIEKTGREKKDFAECISYEWLLNPDGDKCTFLNIKNGVGVCSIYQSRPTDCRRFPGKKCELAENPFYGIPGKKKDIMKIRRLAPTAKMSKDKIKNAQERAMKQLIN
jgi:Fe-S-cluster containining protein